MLYLGLHLVDTPPVVVVSSNTITSSASGLVPRDPVEASRTRSAESLLKNRAVSEPGNETGWNQGSSGRWGRRNVSDSGVEMPDMKQEEEYKKHRHEAIMAREQKKE